MSPALEDVSPSASALTSPLLPDSNASLDSTIVSNTLLVPSSVPDSLYLVTCPKIAASSSVSRFAPFAESYNDMNELRRALKVLSVQKNVPYYMQHSSPQRVEARCPSWRHRQRQGGAATGSEVTARNALPVCEFVVSANRHANGRVYVTRAHVTHSSTCPVLYARRGANTEPDTADPGAGSDENGRALTVTASALLETVLPFMGQLATSRGGRDAVKPKDVSAIMKEKFGVNPSYMTAWRALSAFRKQRKEDDALSYMKLRGYLHAFAVTNVGSLVAFEHQDNSRTTLLARNHPDAKLFARAFLCPKPLHDALRYCRGSMLLSVFLVTSTFG